MPCCHILLPAHLCAVCLLCSSSPSPPLPSPPAPHPLVVFEPLLFPRSLYVRLFSVCASPVYPCSPGVPLFQICSSWFSCLSSVFVLLWYFPLPAFLGHQLIKAHFLKYGAATQRNVKLQHIHGLQKRTVGTFILGFLPVQRLIRSPAGKTNTESFKTSVLFFIAC